MQRLWEIILGLDKGFLGKEGDFSLQFNPKWPFQQTIGAAPWNLLLAILAGLLVWQVYRREGRSRFARIFLGTLRALLLAFLIALLNKPVLTVAQNRTEPSYLAFLIDNSASMQVKDAGTGVDGTGVSRFDAVLNLLTAQDQKFVKDLSKKHILKFYYFGPDAQGLTTVTGDDFAPRTLSESATSQPATRPSGLAGALASIKPDAQVTQVLTSVKTVLQDMQGKRLAGLVLLTDGRDTGASEPDALKTIQGFGARIYPVAVGSPQPPRNIVVEGVDVQDAAFAKDIVAVKVHISGKGYEPGHQVKVTLKDKATGMPLLRANGRPSETMVTITGEPSQEVEITFKPNEEGTLNFIAEAAKQAGEVNDEDNTFPAQVAILDARISVLYVEGYPRWEYRYIKNEMIRDRTVDIACLLYSADRGFYQEGDPAHGTWKGPVKFFPESMTELLDFDVVLFGDVDPNQFTDAQLQLVSDFVIKKFGGFGMIAGPKHSPYSYRNTPIEALLPVVMSRTPPDETGSITNGWRPVLTKDGQDSTIFRFFEDKAQTAKFLKEDIQPLFWYSRGISAKAGAGVVYAEHPLDTGPDGRKAPLLVLGQAGGGRTLFSAIDDSWRWRFYTGEGVFDTYWVQQLRYLATAKKLGQRRFTLTASKPAYERGNLVQLTLRVLDPDLLQQLPEQIGVTIVQKLRNPDGTEREQPVRQENLVRRPGENELYMTSWTADQTGQFEARVPALGPSGPAPQVPIVIKEPHLELQQPEVDRRLLSMLPMDNGANDPSSVDFEKLSLADDAAVPVVRAELSKINSAAMIVPELSKQPLWNAPLAMVIFVLLITLEWVLRKGYGML
jgi:uncharacterized membrane protein